MYGVTLAGRFLTKMKCGLPVCMLNEQGRKLDTDRIHLKVAW
jgi:hypothetical protein